MKVCDFIKKYGGSAYAQHDWEDIVKKHKEYGTCIILWKSEKKEQPIAYARWNEIDSRAHVLDVVIHPDYRGLKMLKELIKLGKTTHSHLHFITYDRNAKYPERKTKIMTINDLLHIGKNKPNKTKIKE